MKYFYQLNIVFILLYLLSFPTASKERWVLDKELSTIEFELPILFANNVKGEFKQIEGLVEIDINKKEHNKAIFSVNLKSIEMNYKKYKNLLLSNIFFDVSNFPVALVDTKKFSYKDQDSLNFDVELTIKGVTKRIPFNFKINHLTEDLVQIKGELTFLRTNFNIGTGKWNSTSILKDKAFIQTNLFLFKE